MGGARLFTVVDPCCKEFLWVGCLVRSNNFSNVSRRSLMYESVDVGNVGKHASHFAVFYMFFSYLIPLDSQDSADGSMVEGGEFAEVVFGQVPGFTAPEKSV